MTISGIPNGANTYEAEAKLRNMDLDECRDCLTDVGGKTIEHEITYLEGFKGKSKDNCLIQLVRILRK